MILVWSTVWKEESYSSSVVPHKPSPSPSFKKHPHPYVTFLWIKFLKAWDHLHCQSVLRPKWLSYRMANLKSLQRPSSSDPTQELQILLLHTSTCWQICISLAIWFSSSLLRLTRLVRFISRVCCHHRGYEAGGKQEKGKKNNNLRINVIWKSISQKTEFPASLGGGSQRWDRAPLYNPWLLHTYSDFPASAHKVLGL